MRLYAQEMIKVYSIHPKCSRYTVSPLPAPPIQPTHSRCAHIITYFILGPMQWSQSLHVLILGQNVWKAHSLYYTFECLLCRPKQRKTVFCSHQCPHDTLLRLAPQCPALNELHTLVIHHNTYFPLQHKVCVL